MLGDFVHSHRTKLEALTQRFRKMKGNHPAKWTLTTGNHDRSAKEKLLAWGFDEFCDEVHEDGIAFSHGHEESRGLSIVGHVHPVIKIGTGRDRMRLPCFWLGRKAFVIPSFGSFTGGFEITPRRHERVYVVAQDSIVEVPVMR